MNTITVTELSTYYEDTLILDNINFNVKTGDIFAISGPSGCGKTTLLNHLIGLLEPTHGSILIQGQDLTHAAEFERLAILKHMGVMYQSGALFSSLTLLENVMLPIEKGSALPEEACKALAMTKLHLVNLAAHAHKYPAEISGGMNKRAAIARALALDPAVIFLDEPSAGLDPATAYSLDALITELSQIMGITFIIVTHDVRSILAIANNMILLHDKKIIAQGAPAVLQHSHDERVKEFFEKGLPKR